MQVSENGGGRVDEIERELTSPERPYMVNFCTPPLDFACVFISRRPAEKTAKKILASRLFYLLCVDL